MKTPTTVEYHLKRAAKFDNHAKNTNSLHKMNIFMELANKQRELQLK